MSLLKQALLNSTCNAYKAGLLSENMLDDMERVESEISADGIGGQAIKDTRNGKEDDAQHDSEDNRPNPEQLGDIVKESIKSDAVSGKEVDDQFEKESAFVEVPEQETTDHETAHMSDSDEQTADLKALTEELPFQSELVDAASSQASTSSTPIATDGDFTMEDCQAPSLVFPETRPQGQLQSPPRTSSPQSHEGIAICRPDNLNTNPTDPDLATYPTNNGANKRPANSDISDEEQKSKKAPKRRGRPPGKRTKITHVSSDEEAQFSNDNATTESDIEASSTKQTKRKSKPGPKPKPKPNVKPPAKKRGRPPKPKSKPLPPPPLFKRLVHIPSNYTKLTTPLTELYEEARNLWSNQVGHMAKISQLLPGHDISSPKPSPPQKPPTQATTGNLTWQEKIAAQHADLTVPKMQDSLRNLHFLQRRQLGELEWLKQNLWTAAALVREVEEEKVGLVGEMSVAEKQVEAGKKELGGVADGKKGESGAVVDEEAKAKDVDSEKEWEKE